MGEVDILESGNFFEEGHVPITLSPAMHEGRGGLHSHTFFEFVYMDKGTSLHTCNGSISVLTAGDLFLVRPGEVHSYVNAHNTFVYNLLFLSEALAGFEAEVSALPGMKRLFADDAVAWEKLHLGHLEQREVVVYLEKIKWEQLNRGVGWQLRLKSLLVSFLVFYARQYDRRFLATEDSAHLPQICRALRFVEDHYTQDFTIKDMAAASGLSPDYMSRRFRAVVGLPPTEYITGYRIARAMEQLVASDKPIATISRESGFGDISHFSRQFKQTAGISPSMYRKTQRQEMI